MEEYRGPWTQPPNEQEDQVVQMANEIAFRIPSGRPRNDNHALDALKSLIENAGETKSKLDSELFRIFPADNENEELESGDLKLEDYIQEFSDLHSSMSNFRALVSRVRQENEENYEKECEHLKAWQRLEVERQPLIQSRSLAVQTGNRSLMREFRNGMTTAFEKFRRESPLMNIQIAQNVLNIACQPITKNDRWRRFIAAEVPELSVNNDHQRTESQRRG
ncbi:hypothetical protein M3Y95_00724400 [Aphelenchoides besseyi]|nr:hypothetical protein M3Y95_00724400 [Aphelenchoides besseyi]